jgi:hypothetical protein
MHFDEAFGLHRVDIYAARRHSPTPVKPFSIHGHRSVQIVQIYDARKGIVADGVYPRDSTPQQREEAAQTLLDFCNVRFE